MESAAHAEVPADEAPEDAAAPPVPAAAPAAPAARRFADMRIRVGDRAQLEPPSQTNVGRVPVRIVGWVEGHALIVTVPQTRVGRLSLQKGEHVLLRVFTGSSAFAFKCGVLKPSRPPFEYLHLSFPDNVEALEVRKSPRYRVTFGTSVVPVGRSESVEVQFENISATGALLRSAEPLGRSGEEIRFEFGFDLHGVPVKLALAATIRSIKSGEDATGAPTHHQGVEFKDVAPNDRLVLQALVWYEMHANPRNAV